jgi:hypothetical protein
VCVCVWREGGKQEPAMVGNYSCFLRREEETSHQRRKHMIKN